MAAKKEEPKFEEAKQTEPVAPQLNPVEELTGQLNYAQKLIAILQQKLNDANGIVIQLEAKLQMAHEK